MCLLTARFDLSFVCLLYDTNELADFVWSKNIILFLGGKKLNKFDKYIFYSYRIKRVMGINMLQNITFENKNLIFKGITYRYSSASYEVSIYIKIYLII